MNYKKVNLEIKFGHYLFTIINTFEILKSKKRKKIYMIFVEPSKSCPWKKSFQDFWLGDNFNQKEEALIEIIKFIGTIS